MYGPGKGMKTVKDVKGIKLLGVKSVNEAVAIF